MSKNIPVAQPIARRAEKSATPERAPLLHADATRKVANLPAQKAGRPKGGNTTLSQGERSKALKGAGSVLARAVDSIPMDPTIEILAPRSRASLSQEAYANAGAAMAQMYDPVSMLGARIPDGTSIPTSVFQNKYRVTPGLVIQAVTLAKWWGVQITQGPTGQYRTLTAVDAAGTFTWSAWSDNPAQAVLASNMLLVRNVGIGGYLLSSGKPLEAQGLVTHGAVVGLATGSPTDNPDNLAYFTSDLMGVSQTPVSLEGEAFSASTFAALDCYGTVGAAGGTALVGGMTFPFEGPTANWPTIYGSPSHAWIYTSPDPAADVRLDLVVHSHYECIPIQTTKSLYNPITLTDAMPELHEAARQILARVPSNCSNRWLAAAMSANEMVQGNPGRQVATGEAEIVGSVQHSNVAYHGLRWSPMKLLKNGLRVAKGGFTEAKRLYQVASNVAATLGYSLPSAVYARHLRWAADRFEFPDRPLLPSPAFEYLCNRENSALPLFLALTSIRRAYEEREAERQELREGGAAGQDQPTPATSSSGRTTQWFR